MNPQRQSLAIRNRNRALRAQSPAMTVHAVTPPAGLLLPPARAVRHLTLKHAQRITDGVLAHVHRRYEREVGRDAG